MRYQSVLRSIARYGLSAMVIGVLNAPVAMSTYAAPLHDEGVQPASLPSNVKVDALLKPINNVLFFSAYDQQHGLELWKTDGTSAGTSLVKDINAGSNNGLVSSAQNRAAASASVVINNTLYFVGSDGKTGFELWKTNGTASGTVLVKDALPGAAPATAEGKVLPTDLTDVNGTLYYAAPSSSKDRLLDLWKSDGTTSGTKKVKSIEPDNLKNVNGKLFFTRGNSSPEVGGVSHDELWTSTGTSSSTKLIKDLYANTSTAEVYDLTVFNSKLFFTSNTASINRNGSTLWTSDGTASGTVAIFQPGRQIDNITSADKLYFITGGDELWSSDGTAKGTKLIKQMSTPTELKSVNGKLFFNAAGENSDQVLWTSNGTAQGTVAIKTITGVSELSYFTNVNGTLFFLALGEDEDENRVTQLWKSDGTSAGTTLVKALPTPRNDFSHLQLQAVKDKLYLTFDEQLWKSDGTSEGTVVVQ